MCQNVCLKVDLFQQWNKNSLFNTRLKWSKWPNKMKSATRRNSRVLTLMSIGDGIIERQQRHISGSMLSMIDWKGKWTAKAKRKEKKKQKNKRETAQWRRFKIRNEAEISQCNPTWSDRVRAGTFSKCLSIHSWIIIIWSGYQLRPSHPLLS